MVQLASRISTEDEIATDKQLLEQFINGNEDAFAELVERHAVMVKGVCNRILRNPSDSDDAFQATFFILASRAKSIVWQDSIGGWLHQVARRVSVKLRSNLGRRRVIETDAAREKQEADSDPMRAVGIRELGEILDKEVEKLPERFREVIILTQAEGLSRSEVASRLGISLAAVKDRLERGRALLQQRLLKRGLTLTSVSFAAWLIPSSAHAAGLQALVTNTCHMATSFTAGKMVGANLTASAMLAQGVLKWMGLQKASMMVALLLTLLTGGSVAYGFLQDNPTRFEEGLRGTLVRLSTDQSPSLTIELDEYQALLDLDIAKDAKVWIAYEATPIEKLKVGQTLAVKLNSDHRTIKEIHAQGIVREGIIKEVNQDGKITFEADDDTPDVPPQTADLAPEAIVRIGGLPATRDDLKPGMTVPLEFGHNGTAVHAIETEAAETQVIEGNLVAINLTNKEIVLAIEDENDQLIQRILQVDSAALIISSGIPLSFDQLRLGSLLKVRLDPVGRTVRAIKAELSELEEVPAGDQ